MPLRAYAERAHHLSCLSFFNCILPDRLWLVCYVRAYPMNGSAVFRSIALFSLSLLALTHGGLAQTAPVPVDVAQVRTADVPLILQGIGTVQAFNAVTV